MTTKEKRQFIRSLCRTVSGSLCAKVSKMPAAWDGHELRELLHESFRAERSSLIEGKRGREYRNECVIKNLP